MPYQPLWDQSMTLPAYFQDEDIFLTAVVSTWSWDLFVAKVIEQHQVLLIQLVPGQSRTQKVAIKGQQLTWSTGWPKIA